MQSERYTHMCVRGLWHQGPLKNPSVTHFVFLKTHYFIFLSPLFYHFFPYHYDLVDHSGISIPLHTTKTQHSYVLP